MCARATREAERFCVLCRPEAERFCVLCRSLPCPPLPTRRGSGLGNGGGDRVRLRGQSTAKPHLMQRRRGCTVSERISRVLGGGALRPPSLIRLGLPLPRLTSLPPSRSRTRTPWHWHTHSLSFLDTKPCSTFTNPPPRSGSLSPPPYHLQLALTTQARPVSPMHLQQILDWNQVQRGSSLCHSRGRWLD